MRITDDSSPGETGVKRAPNHEPELVYGRRSVGGRSAPPHLALGLEHLQSSSPYLLFPISPGYPLSNLLTKPDKPDEGQSIRHK